MKSWLLLLSLLLCPALGAEEEDALNPNHMYAVTFLLGDGATEESMQKMWDYFTDTYPMDTILLPDNFINQEKKTITMIGPSLSQIVNFVEASCDYNKVEIKIMKAGKLTKDSAESVIKKIKSKGDDDEDDKEAGKEKDKDGSVNLIP